MDRDGRATAYARPSTQRRRTASPLRARARAGATPHPPLAPRAPLPWQGRQVAPTAAAQRTPTTQRRAHAPSAVSTKPFSSECAAPSIEIEPWLMTTSRVVESARRAVVRKLRIIMARALTTVESKTSKPFQRGHHHLSPRGRVTQLFFSACQTGTSADEAPVPRGDGEAACCRNATISRATTSAPLSRPAARRPNALLVEHHEPALCRPRDAPPTVH